MNITAHILHSGDMEADYTWLLLKPDRIVKPFQERNTPREFGLAPTHAILVETPEGRMLWDTGAPRDWANGGEPTTFDRFFPVVDDADEDPEVGYLVHSLAQMV